MTIFQNAIEGMSTEDAEKAVHAQGLLAQLMEAVGEAESEELLAPLPNSWDLRALLSEQAARVWDNRVSRGEENPTLEMVTTQQSKDPANADVTYAKLAGPKSVLRPPGFTPILTTPPLVLLVIGLLSMTTGDNGVLVGIGFIVLGIPLSLFLVSKYFGALERRNAHSPDRTWYLNEEMTVELSAPVHFRGDSVELKLMKVVSLVREHLRGLRAWGDESLAVVRAAFDLDVETLKLLSRAGAVAQHRNWLEEYARVQDVRGTLDQDEVDARARENRAALDELFDKTAELVSLYYSVLNLSIRIEAEEDLAKLQQDDREFGLAHATGDGTLELGRQVDETHKAYHDSVLTVREKAERLIADSDTR